MFGRCRCSGSDVILGRWVCVQSRDTSTDKGGGWQAGPEHYPAVRNRGAPSIGGIWVDAGCTTFFTLSFFVPLFWSCDGKRLVWGLGGWLLCCAPFHCHCRLRARRTTPGPSVRPRCWRMKGRSRGTNGTTSRKFLQGRTKAVGRCT
jgi:hypothetical protein